MEDVSLSDIREDAQNGWKGLALNLLPVTGPVVRRELKDVIAEITHIVG